jgi:hypothetical protein
MGHPRGGKTKFAAALAEAYKRVGKKPHFSQTTREMGHPANLHSVTSGALLLLKSKRREKWGFLT